MDLIRNCGAIAYPIILLAILAGALGLAAIGARLVRESRGTSLGIAVAAMVLAGAAFGVGAWGTARGRAVVDRVLPFVDPPRANEIRIAGYAEAQCCTTLGTRFGGATSLLAVAAVVLALTARRGDDGGAPRG